MCAEADSDAKDAGRGKKGLVGDVKEVQDLEEDDEAEDGVRGGAHDGRHGAELGGAVEVARLTVGAPAQAFDEKEHKAMKRKNDEENGDKLRQLVLNDEDHVVVPVALNDSGRAEMVRLAGP